MKYLLFGMLLFSQSGYAQTGARIVTSMGTIVISFNQDMAPKTIENFVKLATGEQKYIDISGKKSKKPFYDGLKIHRVHPDLGIFSGCPWGNGRGWPGYYIFDEASEKSNFSQGGQVAMARIPGDNRVGSQFFITTQPMPRLNGRYTIFAKVISGLDVVKKIAAAPYDVRLRPTQPILIQKVEIIR